MPSFSGAMPGLFPAPLAGTVALPGTPAGPTGQGGSPAPATGAGWEIFVLAYYDYTTVLCQLPTTLINSWQFAKQLNDIGSGSVVLSQDNPWWDNVTLADGTDTFSILDFECLWQFRFDGVTRFEFLGETISEPQLVDPSEQRLVTVTGPGTIATLKWGMAAPGGFPNIVLKLDGLVDDFDEVDGSGNAVLDTNIWNQVSPSADVFITPVQGLYNYPGGALYQLSTLYPSGTCSIAAIPATTFLGTETWDMTDTLVSAQISPVGLASTPTDSSGNAQPYGAGMDGSELTQFYVQSLKNSSYYAMFGLSHNAFYCQEAGPFGTFTKVLATYDPTNHAFWMITEQAGSGGGQGTFYFWTSPDGQTWTKQWSVVHDWDATRVGFYVTATYDVASANFSALLSNLNTNVTTPSYQGNIYLGEPIMGIYHDLLTTAQARGTLPFIATRLTDSADSFGRAWTDSQNVQVTNGTDMYSLLQSFTTTVNADFIMEPGFQLVVGITEKSNISLGADRSQQIIFREGRDEVTKGRTRARDQIQNLMGAENNDGREISSSDPTSISAWGQREGWFQTSAQVDPVSMAIATAAAAEQNADEQLSWTLTIRPGLAGKTVFTNFDCGDWVGLERPDFSAVDAVRVTGIAVAADQTGLETNELTLVSYLQWLEQQLTYIANKLGGSFVNALGTTPVAPSKYGTGQVPTYFTPSSSLANLSDVVGSSGAGGGTSHQTTLVYNAATGLWQPAGSVDPTSGDTLGVTVTDGLGGGTAITGTGVTVSSSPTVPPDGGGAPVPTGSVTTTPQSVLIADSLGLTRVTVGHQSDGTVTVVESNGPAPDAPDAPTVVGGVLGVIVGWDGLLGGAQPLSDFQLVQIHGSTTSGFTPSSATLQGTMPAGGLFGIGGLTAGTTYYVKLVAVNNSNAASTPSTQESGVPSSVPANITPGSITGSQIQTGTITTTQISATAGILGSQLSSTAGITSGQVSFTARNIGGITTTVSGSIPGSAQSGDLWFNSSNGFQLEQYNGSAWVPYQYGTGAIAANAITAALIAANTITAAQIAAGTITATQIAAATITGGKIAAGTITASLLAAGIVVAGIVDATTITGSTLQNSGTNPRTSINPDGSLSITNSGGTVIFKLGPDGTMYWYNSAGVLLMQLQPGGTELIYAASTGPTAWDFEGSTNSWAARGSATLSSSATWSWTGTDSLKMVSTGVTNWGATSPAFAVQAGTLLTMQCHMFTPSALTALSIGFTFFSGTGGGGTNLGTVSGDQGTVSTSAGEVAQFTITGATIPATAQSAVFFVQEGHNDTSGTAYYVDSVSVAGGLVYSNSPVGGTDTFGNVFPPGINFIGLPGLTNVFGVQDPYGNQLMAIDGQGNFGGQVISATDDLVVAGTSLLSTILPPLSGGLLFRTGVLGANVGTGFPGTPQTGPGERALYELDVTLDGGRDYIFEISPLLVDLGGAGQAVLRVYYTNDGSTPTTSSSIWWESRSSTSGSNANQYISVGMSMEYSPLLAKTYRFLVTLQSGGLGGGSPTWQIAPSGVNPGGFYVMDGGSATPDSGVWIGGGTSGATAPQTFTKTWSALNTYSYEGSAGDSSPAPGSGASSRINTNGNAYQGDDQTGKYGNCSTFIAWPAAVASTLSGNTVNSITLTLNNNQSYYATGLTACIGYTTASVGGSSRPTISNGNLLTGSIGKGATKAINLGAQLAAFTTALQAGDAFVLYDPTSSRNASGYFAGSGQSGPPMITVNYTT